MPKNILISGGSGMLGMRLSSLLTEKGFHVSHLTRNKNSNHPYKQFEWDIEQGKIETGALLEADIIIHLAGAGIADKRWTKSRKKVIINSRTETANLLFKKINELNEDQRPERFISASAIGYYGMYTGKTKLTEDSDAGDDFLSEVVTKWEEAADQFGQLGLKVSKLRIGIVLSADGGALPQLAKPVKFGVGAPLGSGNQYMSWVHIDDICSMFHFLIEKNLTGVFNGVSSNPLTNKQMTNAVAKVLDKPLWLPNVPSFAMKLVLGEMAGIVLGGNYVLNDKIINNGYELQYSDLETALKAIYD